MTDTSLDVVLVLDVSGSLADGDALQQSLGLIDRLLSDAPPDTAWAVVAVGGTAQRIVGWTADVGAVRTALQQLSVGGSSPLHDGMVVAGDLLTLRPATARSAVVVIADGDDSGGVATLDDAIGAVQGAEVWAVALPTRDTDLQHLAALVGDAGGAVVGLEDAAGLDRMLGRLTTSPPAASTTVEPEQTVPVPASVQTVPAQTVPVQTVPVQPPVESTPRVDDPAALLLLGGAALFVGVSAGLVLLWPRGGTPAGLGRMADRLSAGAERLLQLAGRRRRLSAVLDAAGVALRPGEVIMAMVTFAASAGLVVGALTSSLVLGFAVGAMTVLASVALLQGRLQRRRKAFAEQLPDLLGSLASALRAGYALNQALDAVAKTASSPAGDELARVVTEVRLGRGLSEALAGVAARTDSRDFAWAVTAMDIHREVGGDLGAIFDTVAETARERLSLEREVHALTAEGRVSAAVLTALPPLLVAVLLGVSPDYLDPLSDGVGPLLLVGAGLLMIIGWWWMRHLVRSGMRS